MYMHGPVDMTDVVDQAVRSRIMASIGGKDTQPELSLRRAIHARGFRFRIHQRNLPGTPDLVFRRFSAVCFVHGCFWHRHAGCPHATSPATRTSYWEAKFRANMERDRRTRQQLAQLGWRTAVVWECALRGDRRQDTVMQLEVWLRGEDPLFETVLRPSE